MSEPRSLQSGIALNRRRLLTLAAGAGLTGWCGGASVATAVSASTHRLVREWGQHGKGEGEFDACIGIAITPRDEVYVSEFRNQRVQKFTPEGQFVSSISLQPHVGALTVDPQGNVYAAHWNSHKIAVYSPTGQLLREWGKMGTADGDFRLPGGVFLGPDGLLYVPDQGNSRIQQFTLEGKFVGKWGSLGVAPGQFGGNSGPGGRFAGPQFLAFDRKGHVYATDVAMDRVQKFTPEGRLLDCWGSGGTEPGGFGPNPRDKNGKEVGVGGPIGLCVDRQDRVWVSATNHRVQQFTNDGKFLCCIGAEEGHGPGQFDIPHGLALDSRGHLYVVDTMNSRIQKFQVT